jgi:hypothetical protein
VKLGLDLFGVGVTGTDTSLDGAGPVIFEATFESDPCNPEFVEPKLEVEFSEKLSLPRDVEDNIIGNLKDSLSGYFSILYGPGQSDSGSYWFGNGGLLENNNISDVYFQGDDKLVVEFKAEIGTHKDMASFTKELVDGNLYLKLNVSGLPAEDSAFSDNSGNRAPSNNVPSKIKGSGTSLNLICEVRQVNNPSGRSSPDPFRRFYVGLNAGALTSGGSGSAEEQPTHYDVEFQIYDLLGNLVWYREEVCKVEEISVVNDSAAVIEINWDYKNMKGRYVASGGYLGMIRVILQPMGTVAKHPPMKIVVRE